jgi:hypothetical protein
MIKFNFSLVWSGGCTELRLTASIVHCNQISSSRGETLTDSNAIMSPVYALFSNNVYKNRAVFQPKTQKIWVT